MDLFIFILKNPIQVPSFKLKSILRNIIFLLPITAGRIQISDTTEKLLNKFGLFQIEERGCISIKVSVIRYVYLMLKLFQE